MNDSTVLQKAKTTLVTKYGNFMIMGFSTGDGKEHVVLVKGEITPTGMLCRIHSECFTGEVFGSLQCDCKDQLDMALALIAEHGSGLIVYLRQEGRGIGLLEKLRAYELQRQGIDTYDANIALGHPADMRDYTLAATILKDLGITSLRLMTNNFDKVEQLETLGIHIEKRLPIVTNHITQHNRQYLQTKKDKMGHTFNL